MISDLAAIKIKRVSFVVPADLRPRFFAEC